MLRVLRQVAGSSPQTVDVASGSAFGQMATQLGATQFLGHTTLEAAATVKALLQGGRPVDSVAAGVVSAVMPRAVAPPRAEPWLGRKGQ